jgi:GH35 family endo-1,4-beta-xylanase
VPMAPDTIGSIVERLHALGVDVAITELDVPGGPNRGPDAQVALYHQTVSECLAAGCSEITVWGVSDERTWLDGSSQREANPLLQAFSLPSNPLLLDVDYEPKATYQAVVGALVEHAGP